MPSRVTGELGQSCLCPVLLLLLLEACIMLNWHSERAHRCAQLGEMRRMKFECSCASAVCQSLSGLSFLCEPSGMSCSFPGLKRRILPVMSLLAAPLPRDGADWQSRISVLPGCLQKAALQKEENICGVWFKTVLSLLCPGPEQGS